MCKSLGSTPSTAQQEGFCRVHVLVQSEICIFNKCRVEFYRQAVIYLTIKSMIILTAPGFVLFTQCPGTWLSVFGTCKHFCADWVPERTSFHCMISESIGRKQSFELCYPQRAQSKVEMGTLVSLPTRNQMCFPWIDLKLNEDVSSTQQLEAQEAFRVGL